MWACPNCSKLVGKTERICPSCGTVMDPGAPDPVRNRLLAILFLVVVTGAGFGYWRKHHPSPRAESPGAAATTLDR